jgi:LysR family transcriptional regulator, glycine cleavage system transcriptional activator
MAMRRGLPPLNACRAFEAAARLHSFSRAAEELNVTATAVSHQVKVLEAWFGLRLFRRRHNSVTLTESGAALVPFLSGALEQVLLGVDHATQSARGSLLTISAQPHFALKWLIPRLPRFAALHPKTEIRLVTGNRGLDLGDENFDAAIRHLDTKSAQNKLSLELRVDHLFQADLMPVASPKLYHPGRIYDPALLRKQTLLHVLSALDDWRSWLAAAGIRDIDAARGPKFDSYALAIEAAAHGWGVAMGRGAFVAGEIAAGRLVAPFGLRLKAEKSWFLLTNRDRYTPHLAAFRSWLLSEATVDRAAPAETINRSLRA